MTTENPAPERIDPAVWARPYSARERVSLKIQAKFDRREIPPVWLWRLLLVDEEHGVPVDDVLWESIRVERRYADPIPAHIYVNWTALNKAYVKGGTFTTGAVPIGISRAEARRLGELLGTHDDTEVLISGDAADPIYIPRPGDIVRFDDDHYAIQQWAPPRRYGPTSMIMYWAGTAGLIEEDVAAPGFGLPSAPTPKPCIPVWPRWAWTG